MNKTKTILVKKSFLSFFFLVTALFYFIKAESSVYAPVEFCYYGNPTEIELVISTELGIDSSSYNLENILICFTNVPSHLDFLRLYKLLLLYYEAFVIHRLNSYEQSFNPSHHLNSILRKHNIWHQSSDDPPALFS